MHKRKYLVTLLALVSVLSLAGCGKKEEATVIDTPDGTIELSEEMVEDLMNLVEEEPAEEVVEEKAEAKIVGNIPTLNEMQFAIEDAGMVYDEYHARQERTDNVDRLYYNSPGHDEIQKLITSYVTRDEVMDVSERVARWKDYIIPSGEPNINTETHFCLESDETEFKNGCTYHTIVLVNHDRRCNPVEQKENCYAYEIHQFITKGDTYVQIRYDADENYEPIDENVHKYYKVLEDLQYTIPDEAN